MTRTAETKPVLVEFSTCWLAAVDADDTDAGEGHDDLSLGFVMTGGLVFLVGALVTSTGSADEVVDVDGVSIVDELVVADVDTIAVVTLEGTGELLLLVSVEALVTPDDEIEVSDDVVEEFAGYDDEETGPVLDDHSHGDEDDEVARFDVGVDVAVEVFCATGRSLLQETRKEWYVQIVLGSIAVLVPPRKTHK